MTKRVTTQISYFLFLLIASFGAIFTFTDSCQMDLCSGRVRWVKEIYGLPMLYFYEDSLFSEKVKQFNMKTSLIPVWVTDSRIPLCGKADNSRNQFHGIIWHCNTACQLLDNNCVSLNGQKIFIAYTLEQLAEKQVHQQGFFSAEELITLCGGVIAVSEQVKCIPLDAQIGNLLEYYIETQFGPHVENLQMYYSSEPAYATRF